MTTIEYIREKVPRSELLAQLAEEAAELAQAALKLRRTIVNTNPTPVSEEEALNGLYEEIADVELCIWALKLQYTSEQIAKVEKIIHRKAARWCGRVDANHVKE